MKILITGNMGYVGPVLTRHLRTEWPDAILIGYDTGFFGHCLTGALTLPEKDLQQQHFGDLRDFPTTLLKGVDVVVHLAAISNDPMGNTYEAVTMEINLHASLAFANAAKNAGVRKFIFASSCSVYGFADTAPRKEESSLNPLTAYARSKVQMEEGLQKLANPNFEVSCLRFATACGASDRLRLDLVLNDFVASAMVTNQITILSDGTPWRPLINVKDMARAIEWAVKREQANGGYYLVINTGSDQWNYNVKALAEGVQQVFPSVAISINSSAPPDKRSYKVDFAKFRQAAPLHQPLETLSSSIYGLKECLERMNFKDADFRRSPLMRLVTLTQHRIEGRLNDNLRWKIH